MISIKAMKSVFFGIGLVAMIAMVPAYAQTSGAPVLSQTSITLGLGQTATVTSQGGTNVYLLYNSSPIVASISANGTQITATGVGLGSTSANICAVGSASDCANLTVTVQATVAQALSFNPSSVSLSLGGAQAVAVSGGNGTYSTSGSPNASVATASLASNTLTITAVGAGTAAVTVCDQSQNCGTVNITISSSPTSANQTASVTFSVTNPEVAAGQTKVVSLTSRLGTFVFHVIYNSDANVVQATTDNANLSLRGISAGSALLTVCAAGDGCNQLNVKVTGTVASPAPPPSAPAGGTSPAPAPTPTPPPPAASTTDTSSVLAAIQTMQTKLAQMLQEIQAMTASLAKLSATLLAQNTGKQTAIAGISDTSSVTFTQYLVTGSENYEVTALQNLLTRLGFYSGPVSGYFGALTEEAVRSYQSARGISPVGYVGPSTRTALNAE